MDQRPGETYKEYETRKKRVKRARQGVSSGLSNALLGGTPRVVRSTISVGQADGIMVQWSLPMTMSCDIKNQINVIIDGAAPIHPVSIDFHPHNKSQMGIIMAVPFTAGQAVTWAYDDTESCDLHQDGDQTNEADNQTYGVTNKLASPAPSTRIAFSDGFSDGFK